MENKQTTYNKDEYWIAKEVTEQLLAKDLEEGKTSKYILKIMSDPMAVPHWE